MHQSMFLTKLDFSWQGPTVWRDYIGTKESGGGVIVNYLPLVTIAPYVGGVDRTQIDNAVYSGGKILLHREYWYEEINYQNCFVILSVNARPASVDFIMTKGLVDWGWGVGDTSIAVYDETWSSIGFWYTETISETPDYRGTISLTYEEREAGMYWPFGGTEEFFYPGGFPNLAHILISSNAGSVA